MIRVLHYIGGLNSGGAESFIMNVYRNIDRDKIQFDFIVDHPKQDFYFDEIKKMGGNIYIINPVYKCGYFEFKNNLKKIVNDGCYAIIHVHVRSTATFIFKALKKMNIYKVMHSHNNSNGKNLSSLLKYVLQIPLKNQVDYKFACSESAGEFVFSKKGVKNNYMVVPNGIDTDKYVFNYESRNLIRSKYNISNDSFVVGHIGRFVKQKNHKFIIELANSIPDVYFILIGDGPTKNKLKNKVKNNNIIFVESTEEVNKFYSAFDLFILPSLWEGLGIVLIEAQYNGLNCLVSDAIQDEAIITNNVKKISINKNLWLEEISSKKRRSFKNIIVDDNRFDIRTVSAFLQKFYYDIYERK